MKRKLLTTTFVIAIATSCFAQQEITIKKKADNSLDKEIRIADEFVSPEKLDTRNEIVLKPETGLNPNYTLFNVTKNQDVSTQIIGGKIQGIDSAPTLKLTIKVTGQPDLVIDNIGKDPNKPNPPADNTTISATDYLVNLFNSSTYNYHDLKILVRDRNRYNSKKDEAYLILDERGKLIGNVPVNIDQDDKIYIYLVLDNKQVDNYDIEVIGGEYNPIDLQIRSYEAINTTSVQGKLPKNNWTVVRFERGPYTSENVTINIKKTSGENTEVISTYTVRINKLYHVAIGASFITTNLAKPDFDVFPLTETTNTINTVNNGSRTMFTFNVIWYWQNTFKYFKKGSDLTRGRDILKEPDWITRLNPTFGVALDNTYKENTKGWI